MTDELIIEQPSITGGTWLSPGKRTGHLVAIFNVSRKVKQWDSLAEKEREVATFDFVDLDEERTVITEAQDNHPGITFRLKTGNPAVILGRITTTPSQNTKQKDQFVLSEHDDSDAVNFRAWHAQTVAQTTAQNVAQNNGAPVQAQAPQTPAQAPVAVPQTQSPAPVPVPVPVPQNSMGQELPDLSAMNPETLALIAKALQQQNPGT